MKRSECLAMVLTALVLGCSSGSSAPSTGAGGTNPAGGGTGGSAQSASGSGGTQPAGGSASGGAAGIGGGGGLGGATGAGGSQLGGATLAGGTTGTGGTTSRLGGATSAGGTTGAGGREGLHTATFSVRSFTAALSVPPAESSVSTISTLTNPETREAGGLRAARATAKRVAAYSTCLTPPNKSSRKTSTRRSRS